MSQITEPLNKLTRKGTSFQWTYEQDVAFQKIKTIISSQPILQHYDKEKCIMLSCDASPEGIGAVLSHEVDGRELPIAFASRSLTKAEKNCSHLEKEALAIVFGVKKFRLHLLGRSDFNIITDHKPLIGILNQRRAISELASPRLQRWNLILGAYNYIMIYRKGKENGNADFCSRFLLEGENCETPEPADVVLTFEKISSRNINSMDVARETNKDPVLSKVRNIALQGWTIIEPSNKQLLPYFKFKEELSVDKSCLLRGNRVVIPRLLQQTVLKELHDIYPGIIKVKRIARSYVWWPSINLDIEATVRECTICLQERQGPPKSFLRPWQFPEGPWQRLHIDYAEPVSGRYLLILIDSYSKWIEALPVTHANSISTIEALGQVFATHGLPVTIVSDNASCFSSVEFKSFLQSRWN